MTQIKSGASVFLVRDVVKSANFYRDALGFSYECFWGEPPDFCMVWRNQQCIMLSQVAESELIRPVSRVRPPVWDAYFWVDDVDAFYAEFSEKDVRFKYEPVLKTYGVKEFAVLDQDGYQLAFGEEVE